MCNRSEVFAKITHQVTPWLVTTRKTESPKAQNSKIIKSLKMDPPQTDTGFPVPLECGDWSYVCTHPHC